ncbi:hypothetical protein A0U95_04245 [Pseudomonas brassicacearum]|uniref:hypothetical protein n=1 Tax=Pseudomonas brassicacearum TaxID=930166 RepID=UPI00085980FC|nr:hypothetical protein [Pseudomonas brassicacearum]AOS37990.1 hypothetical protein A0U95_04245 [Pseudomonas brassicacearum]
MSFPVVMNLSEDNIPMKLVYRLQDDLETNRERVSLTQSLTLDKARPLKGLKGTYGLFGSSDWWRSIHQGQMPLLFVSGVILRAYVAGQDKCQMNNMVDLKLEDGSVRAVGIYVNDKSDVQLFQPGYKASVVYALDELKQQPASDGGVNYSRVALEMAVSLQTIIK